MKITADTNLLVRVLTSDDVRQSRLAEGELAEADKVAITLPALCELVWVLARGYGITPPDIAEAIRRLVDAKTVVANRPAIEAGLALMTAGGDFADGVIAYEGRHLGTDVFVSFDRKAVTLVNAQGHSARLL